MPHVETWNRSSAHLQQRVRQLRALHEEQRGQQSGVQLLLQLGLPIDHFKSGLRWTCAYVLHLLKLNQKLKFSFKLTRLVYF